MRNIPNIKTMKMVMTFWKTIDNPSAGKVDMYLLNDDETGEGLISIGVPHGREDIATFLYRSCIAGQRVLNECRISNIEDFKP